MDFQELRLGSNTKTLLDGGVSFDDETLISLNQSPYMVNMCYDDGGLLVTRDGQANLYENFLGDKPINGVYGDYKGKTVIAHGTKLYTQINNDNPIEIYNSLTDSGAFFFVYNGILYMLNGYEYIQYDGVTVKNVEPYIPKVSINRKPDGTDSTVNESWNLLGSGFTDQFNGDGTATKYKLSFDNLDSTTVKAKVNNVEIVEGNGLTVDRTTGEITFTTAPSKGQNNVLITAYKTFTDNVSNVLKCTKAIEFSNRVFITGNKDLPNYYWASGVNDNVDASYFPTKYKYAIRGSDKAVTNFIVFHNKLIVFKEDLTAVVEASTGLDNTASFPISYLNTEIGCDIPNSIQLINNCPVFANTYGGVYAIVSTMIPDEKNIIPISFNVNGSPFRSGILQEDTNSLKKASSVDYGYKYHLCVDNKVYVLDYSKGFKLNKPKELTWLLYNNINAKRFFIRHNELMYSARDKGMITKFIPQFNDFGQPIYSSWKSKLMDFGYSDYIKKVKEIWLTTKANSNPNVKINYYTDKMELVDSILIGSTKLKSFSWKDFSWKTFTWRVQIFPATIKLKVNTRKIRYFQIELTGEKENYPLSIVNLIIKYKLTKKVK